MANTLGKSYFWQNNRFFLSNSLANGLAFFSNLANSAPPGAYLRAWKRLASRVPPPRRLFSRVELEFSRTPARDWTVFRAYISRVPTFLPSSLENKASRRRWTSRRSSSSRWSSSSADRRELLRRLLRNPARFVPSLISFPLPLLCHGFNRCSRVQYAGHGCLA